MASLILEWNNTNVNASANATAQRVSKRLKSVGGAFSTSGFTPANDLAKTANTISATVDDNKIYEFKVEAICSVGGPTPNNNGLVEGISFACIVPTFEKTGTSGQVIVDVTGLDISKIAFTLKKYSDNSLISTQTVSRVGNSVTGNFSGLSVNTQYYVEYELIAVVNGVEVTQTELDDDLAVCGVGKIYNFTTDYIPDLIWIPLSKVCEKTNLFGVEKTIAGLSSPLRSGFDPTTGRMYVADLDATSGNVYWFDPDTATTLADMTFSAAVNQDELYNNYIDIPNRKIYLVGRNSSGLIVYDIATNTASTVAFGTNVPFARTVLTVIGDRIYCNDGSTSIVIIDRNTLTVITTVAISGIPTPARFTNPFYMIGVGAEIWVVCNNGSVSQVGVYDANLTTLIASITLPGAATWTYGAYWQKIFFDVASNMVYVSDAGSGRQYLIDATTRIVQDQRSMYNAGGKTNVLFGWFLNPISNDLVAEVQFLNAATDGAPIKRMYIENRADFAEFMEMYTDFYINQAPALIPGSNRFVGCDPGNPSWAGIPGWNTDGTITILDSSIDGQNTGRGLITFLQEVDHNNADTPTGETKENQPMDPDYIPPIDPDADCAVTYTTDEPHSYYGTFNAGTLNWEFAIDATVKNNPAINSIRVTAWDLDVPAVEGTPTIILRPFPGNYFKGTFASLTETNYTILVEYLDVSNSVLDSHIL